MERDGGRGKRRVKVKEESGDPREGRGKRLIRGERENVIKHTVGRQERETKGGNVRKER